nr:MAG TPA: hypothetical protein [Caudoviricetes sp.]
MYLLEFDRYIINQVCSNSKVRWKSYRFDSKINIKIRCKIYILLKLM